jgi:glycosyltransferase involved in cell wall biosynthesis
VGLIHRAFWGRPRLRDWADQLEAAGHHTVVFSSGVDPQAGTDRRTFVPVPLGRGESFDRAGFVFAVRLYRALLRHPVDALFCIDSTAYFGAWLAARRLRVPSVMSFQGLIFDPGYRGTYQRTVSWVYKLEVHFCARWAPLIGCISPAIFHGLMARGAPPERLWLTLNCVDLERWRTGKVGAHVRAVREVLYVGGLREVKGIDVLLAALPRVIDRLPAVRFRVLGAPSEDTPYHDMARRLHVEEHVDFSGFVSRDALPDVYASADLMVSPSRAEGHAKAVIECLACGTPVVASDIPGMRESIRHEENGLLVRPQDPAALADAICRMLSDHALLDRLSGAARPSVERLSRWPERIGEFEERTARLRACRVGC